MQKTRLMLLSCCMAIAFLASAFAEDKPIHAKGAGYVMPKNSPVQFLSANEYGTNIKFKGQFVLTGTYRYGYLSDEGSNDPDLSFLPEKSIAAILPYWSGRGHVKEIRFNNPEKFVEAVIPVAGLKKLKSKSGLSLSGQASVLVNGYEVSIDCDVPTYSVNFVSVLTLPRLVAGRSLLSDEGC